MSGAGIYSAQVTAGSVTDPTEPGGTVGTARCTRGGSWFSSAYRCSTVYRAIEPLSYPCENRSDLNGLRVVRSF